MIEETLNNEKGHPAETALAMLSFLQSELPAGGPAAESRFFHSLYGPLCDRIFGAILGDRPEDGYRHQDGGWLSLQVRWSRPPSLAMTLVSSSSSPRHRTGNIPGLVRSVVATDTTDPVLQLLGTPDKPQRPHAAHNVAGKDDGVVVVVVVEPVFAAPPTLLESIANATDRHPSVGFAFEFYALPKHTQEAWIYLVESVLGGSTAPTTATASTTTPTTTNSIDDICTYNDVRLLGYLLQNRPEEQTQLRLLKQQQQQRSVLTSHENFRHFASHPHHAAGGSPRGFHSFSPPSSSSATPVATPLLLGSVKLSSPGQIPGRASETATTASPKVMLTMLEHYLVLFLRYPTKPPDRQAVSMSTIPGVHVHRIAAPSLTTATAAGSRNSSSSSNTMREAFGDRVYCHVFDRYMKYFLPHEPDEGRYIAFATDETNRDSELFLRLLISLWIDSLAPVVRTQRVLQLFLDRNRRIGMDDASLLSTLDLSASYDLTQRVEPYRATLAPIQKCLRRLIDHALLDPKISAPATTTSLSPCMIALAYPFYNYVRTSFRFASIHSLDSAFYGALDSWLVWLEPWNVVVHCKFLFTIRGEDPIVCRGSLIPSFCLGCCCCFWQLEMRRNSLWDLLHAWSNRS